MIEQDLRAHYASLTPGSDAEQRVLSALPSGPPPRRARTGLAAAGAVAAIGVAAAVVTTLPGSHDPSPAARPQKQHEVTPQVVVQNLIKLVSGKGTATDPSGFGMDDSTLHRHGVQGSIKFKDAGGRTSKIDVELDWTPKSRPVPKKVPELCDGEGTTCSYVAGGWKVEADPQKVVSDGFEAHAFRASDGLEVRILEWHKHGSPPPPFTIDELTAMSTSSTWSATATSKQIAAADKLFIPG